MREFNVTGICNSDLHYMVDTNEKLDQIASLIEKKRYFTINRARQYGKSTTLRLLQKKLKEHYICLKISFETSGDIMFESEANFCQRFLWLLSNSMEMYYPEYIILWKNDNIQDFQLLSAHISKLCENKNIILMIDEVDKTSNNQVFLHFLGMLRNQYNLRQEGNYSTFYSVILAGVYDIKNIKLKLIKEGIYNKLEQEGIYNSPWNIAVDFDIDMSFNPREIVSMLDEYKKEHTTVMDTQLIAQIIYDFTGGYPYLVSRICQHIDEKLLKDWTQKGVQEAVKLLLLEKNTLFDDINKNLENNEMLYQFIYDLLILGESKSYQIDNPLIDLGVTYGFFKNNNGRVAISNQIFEIRILNYFISKDESNYVTKKIRGVLPYDVIKNDKFDMKLCLEKFAIHYHEIFTENEATFFERHGRILFLTYLKPLINGKGFYHIESELLDLRRMDIVVDYGTEQFIIELKLWHGQQAHEDAYKQLISYMESKNTTTGYLLTFNFNKKCKAEWVLVEGMNIFDIVV